MKTLFLYTILILSCLFPASGQETDPLISNETALKVIEIFRQDPLSVKGKGAAALILRFTEESKDVVVQLSARNVPWLSTRMDTDAKSRLLAAYLAGSVKSQLTKKNRKDDPLAGAEQVIESYQKMRKTNPSLTVPSVEEWIKLKSAGKLAAHFAAPESAAPAAK